MQTIRVGVIGVGYLGLFHARKYAAMEGVKLVGVADSDGERAALVAAECATTPFTDFARLIDQVDAVSVVTPTSLHHEVTKRCLERGVDVMLEKPITTTLLQADDLIRLARSHGRILQVGHLERFNPAIQAMRPLITCPLFIESHRLAPFKDRGTDVDVVLDLMIHDLDLVFSLVDAPIASIQSAGASVVTALTDIASARLVFTNGCSANITVSRVSLDTTRRMRIFQPGSYVVVDFAAKEVTQVELAPARPDAHPEPRTSSIPVQDHDALEHELRAFIGHVRERTRPEVAGEEGRRALDVALQVIERIHGNQEQIREDLRNRGRDDLLRLLER
ncbi:MAG: Gfo/Idh/MocA family oxidoreductase [Desulfobulbus sp.]|jgi:predicted dehydrogenase